MKKRYYTNKMESLDKALLCLKIVGERKALNPLLFEVVGLSSVTDYFLLISGNSSRQVQAISRHLNDRMREEGFRHFGIEGQQEGQWILMDYGDVVVHIFYEPTRVFYDLEGLWAEAPKVTIDDYKRASRPFNRIGFFLILLIILFPTHPDRSDAAFLSNQDEMIMGQQFLLQIRNFLDIADDEYANRYINILGNYLLQPIQTRPFPFHFYLVNGNDLNAFAAPGGHIFIYTGLIGVMDEIDELAGVMCHEIAHVTARHLAKRIEQTKKLGYAQLAAMILGALIGGKGGAAMMMGSQAASVQAQLNYSRNDERQADQLGFKYMEASGFDPSGLAKSLTKIQQGQWFDVGKIPPYLLTHPTGPARLNDLDVMNSSYRPVPMTPEAKRLKSEFLFFKTVLRAKYQAPQAAEKFFKGDLAKDPDSPLANFGLAVMYKEEGEAGRAIEHFKKALAKTPDEIIVLQNLGEAYQLKGEDREAIKVLGEGLKKDSLSQQTLFLLANSYENLEEYSRAIPIYERLTSMRPIMHQDVFYRLGVCYGRLGRLGRAHYNFGIFFKRMMKLKKARFHFDKARDLSVNDPALRDRINNAAKGLEESKDDG